MRRYDKIFARSEALRGELARHRQEKGPALERAEKTLAALQRMDPIHRQTHRFHLLVAGGCQSIAQNEIPVLREILPDGVDDACFRALRLAKQVRLTTHPRKEDLVRFHVAPRAATSRHIGEMLYPLLRDVLEDAQVMYEDGQILVRGQTAFVEQNPAVLRNLRGGTLVSSWQEILNAGLVTQIDLELGSGEIRRPVLSAKAYVERLLWLPRIAPEEAKNCLGDALTFLGEAFVAVLLGHGEEHLPFVNEWIEHRHESIPEVLKGNPAFEKARVCMHLVGDARTEIKQFALEQFGSLRLLGLESDPSDSSLLRLPAALRCDIFRGVKGAFSLQLLWSAFDMGWFAAGLRTCLPSDVEESGPLDGAVPMEEPPLEPFLRALEAITGELATTDPQLLTEGICQAGNIFRDQVEGLNSKYNFNKISKSDFSFLKNFTGKMSENNNVEGFFGVMRKSLSSLGQDMIEIDKNLLEALRMLFVFLHKLMGETVNLAERSAQLRAEECRGWAAMATSPLKETLRALVEEIQADVRKPFSLVLEREHAAWLRSFDKTPECAAFSREVLALLKKDIPSSLARKALEAVWRANPETAEGVMPLFQHREEVVPALSEEGAERFVALESQWRKHVLGLGVDMEALPSDVVLCWPAEVRES